MTGATGIIIGLAISFFTFDPPDLKGTMAPQIYTASDEKSSSLRIDVEVAGEGIHEPGHYRMSPDSRVIDLVKRAGGVNTGAITETIDWHAPLYDGLKLTIPTHEVLREVRKGKRTLRDEDLIYFRAVQQTQPDTEFVHINRATAVELKSLSGIGDVLADRIIQYRDREGPFRKKEQLKDILGIGEVTYQELRSKITLR